jgi:hypothetical protein
MKFPAIMLSTFDYLQGEIAALQSQAGKKRIKIKTCRWSKKFWLGGLLFR